MAHPSDAVDHLLVRVLLDPRRMAPRYFILTRAARLSLDSSRALFILRLAFPCSIPKLQHLSSLIRMRLLYPRDAVKVLWTGDFVMLEFAHVH